MIQRVASCAAALTFCAAVLAAQEQNPAHPARGGGQPESPNVLRFVDRSKWVLDLHVVDPSGERLGDVDDVAIARDGRILYAAFDPRGAGQPEGHLLAVPWGCLQIDYDDQRAVLDAQRAQIEAAEAFDRDDDGWPEAPTFACAPRGPGTGGADRYPATGPGASGGPPGNPQDPGPREAAAPAPTGAPNRLTWFRNRRVETAKGERLGVVEEVAVDVSDGRASYIALREAGADAGKLIAVPWPALKFVDEPVEDQAEKGPRLVLEVSREQLEGAPMFKPEEAQWGKMSEPDWVQRLYEHYGYTPYFGPRAGLIPGAPGAVDPGAPGRPGRTPPAGGQGAQGGQSGRGGAGGGQGGTGGGQGSAGGGL